MATHKALEVTLIYAKDLKKVNIFSQLQIYAVASLSSDPRAAQRTPTDRVGRRNPTWNATVLFPIPYGVDPSHLTLDVVLRAERAFGDRDVGEVHVPLADLHLNLTSESAQFATYQVRRRSGRSKGLIYFSYRFVDLPSAKVDASLPMGEEPVVAYPAYPQPGPYAPPAGYPGHYQQPGYGYAHAPPPAYGYGYGSAAAAAQPQRKNKFGMGLGAGLLGGALGGMLIGDALSDAYAYDAGYDAGFGDSSFGF